MCAVLLGVLCFCVVFVGGQLASHLVASVASYMLSATHVGKTTDVFACNTLVALSSLSSVFVSVCVS